MSELTISCEEAKELLNNHQAQLVDVRSTDEYNEGALPNAISVPLGDIIESSENLDKSRPVILYCVTGTRTKIAKVELNNLGFKKVYDLGSYQTYLECN